MDFKNNFFFKIYLNNILFDKNKKNIILIIKKSVGEIDWILPVLDSLKQEFNIFTIFQKKITLEHLQKKSSILFDIWKNTSFAYTIQPNLKAIFLRSIRKIFSILRIKNLFFLDNIINKKGYNVSELITCINKKLNLPLVKFELPEALFVEFTNKSQWIDQMKNQKTPLKIFQFPHTTTIFGSTNTDVEKSKIEEKGVSSSSEKNEILLLSNKMDRSYWESFFPYNKIYVCGYLKYDQPWKDKIFNNISNKENKHNVATLEGKKIILVSYNGFKKTYYKNSYINQINTLMNLCNEIDNIHIVFKLHPFTERSLFFKIINKFPKKYWSITENHLLYEAKKCDIFISFFSAASSLDALAVGKIPIELWKVHPKTSNFYEKLGLVIRVKNEDELKKVLFERLVNIKKPNIDEGIQLTNFEKICYSNGSIMKTKNLILKELK